MEFTDNDIKEVKAGFLYNKSAGKFTQEFGVFVDFDLTDVDDQCIFLSKDELEQMIKTIEEEEPNGA